MPRKKGSTGHNKHHPIRFKRKAWRVGFDKLRNDLEYTEQKKVRP